MDPVRPLQQHPSFARALRAMGRPTDLLTLRDAGGAAIGWVLALRPRLPLVGRVGYVPRGPVWADGVPVEARATALAALPIHLVEADAPCPSLRVAGFRLVATPAHVAEVDLAPDHDARRGRMGAKWRGHLHRAERSGLAVEAGVFDGDPNHWLLAREAAMRCARGYRALPQAVACAYARANPGLARLLVAREGGEPVAAILLLLHHPVATYHIGWTGERGRAASAHHLLLSRAADALADAGYLRLDLGTLDTEASPGLARFKIGAGARVRPLGGSWLRMPLARRLALRGPSR